MRFLPTNPRIMAFLVLVFLSGCATQGPVPLPSHLQLLDDSELVNHIENFEAQGRLQLRQSGQVQNANFHWLEQDGHISIQIFGPLGLGGMTLQVAPNGKSTLTAQGKRFEANSAETLLADIVDFPLPVSAFKDSLKGKPIKSTLETSDYTLDISDTFDKNPLALPRKLNISLPRFTLRVIIEKSQVLSWK